MNSKTPPQHHLNLSLRPHEDNEAKTKREEPSEKKTPGHNGKTLNGSAGEGEGRGRFLGRVSWTHSWGFEVFDARPARQLLTVKVASRILELFEPKS